MLFQEVKEIIASTSPDFVSVHLMSMDSKPDDLGTSKNPQKKNLHYSFYDQDVLHFYQATKDLETGKVIFDGEYKEYNSFKNLNCQRHGSIFKGPYHYKSHVIDFNINANFDDQGKLDGHFRIDKEIKNEDVTSYPVIEGSFAHGIPQKITKEVYDTCFHDNLISSCTEKYDEQGAIKKVVSFDAQTGTIIKTTYDKDGSHTKVGNSHKTLQKIIIAGCLVAFAVSGIKACSNHPNGVVSKQAPQNQRG